MNYLGQIVKRQPVQAKDVYEEPVTWTRQFVFWLKGVKGKQVYFFFVGCV